MKVSGPPTKIVAAQPTILLGMRRGLSLGVAAQSAGITYRTLRKWVKRGEAERERREEFPEEPILKEEALYYDFLASFEEARAEGEMLLADVVKRSADGGAHTKETRMVETIIDGVVVKKETTVVEREVGPDWKAAAFILERRHGWGRHDRTDNVEVDLESFTTEELQRVINGEDPLTVISERAAQISGSRNASDETEADIGE